MYGGKKHLATVLPFTGFGSMRIALLAIVLLAVGLILVRVAMMRNSEHQ